jgi:hypothetical protein
MYQLYCQWGIKMLLKPLINFAYNNINRQSHGGKYKESKDKGEKTLNE